MEAIKVYSLWNVAFEGGARDAAIQHTATSLGVGARSVYAWLQDPRPRRRSPPRPRLTSHPRPRPSCLAPRSSTLDPRASRLDLVLVVLDLDPRASRLDLDPRPRLMLACLKDWESNEGFLTPKKWSHENDAFKLMDPEIFNDCMAWCRSKNGHSRTEANLTVHHLMEYIKSKWGMTISKTACTDCRHA